MKRIIFVISFYPSLSAVDSYLEEYDGASFPEFSGSTYVQYQGWPVILCDRMKESESFSSEEALSLLRAGSLGMLWEALIWPESVFSVEMLRYPKFRTRIRVRETGPAGCPASFPGPLRAPMH